MDIPSTPYLFQYTYFVGKEYSLIVNSKLSFDNDYWFKAKVDELVAKTLDLPDNVIKTILKKANVC